MGDKQYTSSSMSLGGVLTVIFVVLKLVGVIEWSWWWVLSPLWISLGVWLVIALLAAAIAAIVILLEDKK